MEVASSSFWHQICHRGLQQVVHLFANRSAVQKATQRPNTNLYLGRPNDVTPPHSTAPSTSILPTKSRLGLPSATSSSYATPTARSPLLVRDRGVEGTVQAWRQGTAGPETNLNSETNSPVYGGGWGWRVWGCFELNVYDK